MEDGGDYEQTSRPSLPAGKATKVHSEGADQNQEPQMDQRPRTSAAAPKNHGGRPNEFKIGHIERDAPLRNSFPIPLLMRPNQTDNEGDSDFSPGLQNQSLPNLASKTNLNHSSSRMDEPINLSYQKRAR